MPHCLSISKLKRRFKDFYRTLVCMQLTIHITLSLLDEVHQTISKSENKYKQVW